MIVESGIRTKLLSGIAAAALVVSVAACSGGGDKSKTHGTTTGIHGTTTTTALGVGVQPDAYVESGDYVNGRHIADIKSFDEVNVTFDVVQFLTGDAAVAAFHEDHPGEDGPDNDYYVRNQNTQLRTLPVSDDVVIRMNITAGYEPSDPDKGHAVTRRQLASSVKSSPGILYWLTIKDAKITAIEEQYQP